MSVPAAARRRAAVLVSGSGSNLQAMIDCRDAGHLDLDFVAVISDRPGAYALERARRAGIPAMTLDYRAIGDRDAFAGQLRTRLEDVAAELVALAGFMRILPGGLVERYRGRMLNVHPSLLPDYPGLDTHRRVLAAGEAWHGSTVHFVIPALDAGPGIIQYRVRIGTADTEDSLRHRIQAGEHRIYPQALQWLASGRVEQRNGGVWKDGVPLPSPEVVTEPASEA